MTKPPTSGAAPKPVLEPRAEAARRVLIQLAKEQIPPTPEAFCAMYETLSPGSKPRCGQKVNPLYIVRILDILAQYARELGEPGYAELEATAQAVKRIIEGEIGAEAVYEFDKVMKAAAKRQKKILDGWIQTRSVIINLATQVRAQAGSMGQDVGRYAEQLDEHLKALGPVSDPEALQQVIKTLLTDTRSMRDQATVVHKDLDDAHARALESEARLEKLQQEYQSLITKVKEDFLTQTLNRRGLEEAFAVETARAQRDGQPLSVAVLDIDHFKSFNDSYGHATGDGALTHVAAVIKDCLRPMDVVARYGGEEFVLLLPHANAAQGKLVMERVQRELTKRIFMHKELKLLITFSSGVTEWLTGEAPADTVTRADEAMYEAKQAGRNRVHVARIHLEPDSTPVPETP